MWSYSSHFTSLASLTPSENGADNSTYIGGSVRGLNWLVYMVSGQQPATGEECYAHIALVTVSTIHGRMLSMWAAHWHIWLAPYNDWYLKSCQHLKIIEFQRKKKTVLSVLRHWEHTHNLEPVLLVLYGSCHFMGDMLFSSSWSLSSLNGSSTQVVTVVIYQLKPGPHGRSSYFVSIYWVNNILKNLCSMNWALKWPILIAPLPVSPGPPKL